MHFHFSAAPAVLVSRIPEYPAPILNSMNLPYQSRAEESLYHYNGPYHTSTQQMFEGHISPYGMAGEDLWFEFE